MKEEKQENLKKIRAAFYWIPTSLSLHLLLCICFLLGSCSNPTKERDRDARLDKGQEEAEKRLYASDLIPFFDQFSLILGDGSNVGYAQDFEHEDFFYTENDGSDTV